MIREENILSMKIRANDIYTWKYYSHNCSTISLLHVWRHGANLPQIKIKNQIFISTDLYTVIINKTKCKRKNICHDCKKYHTFQHANS